MSPAPWVFRRQTSRPGHERGVMDGETGPRRRETEMRTLGAVLLAILIVVAGNGCSGPVEPGFRVSHETWHAAIPGAPGSTFWQVTNMQDEPLTINRVTYNGEWEAKLADDTGGNPSEGGLPITLGIGESCNFFEYCYSEDPAFVAQNRRFIDDLKDVTEGKTQGTSTREHLEKAEREGRMGRVYRKEVIYIDIETNRGTFRYRPNEWRFERLD